MSQITPKDVLDHNMGPSIGAIWHCGSKPIVAGCAALSLGLGHGRQATVLHWSESPKGSCDGNPITMHWSTSFPSLPIEPENSSPSNRNESRAAARADRVGLQSSAQGDRVPTLFLQRGARLGLG